MHARTGQVALAVTVMEDVVAVIMLAVLGAQAAMGAEHLNVIDVCSALQGLSAAKVR